MDYCWQEARNSAVRQMGWSLFSPPILSESLETQHRSWSIPEDDEARWILKHIDDRPATLEAYLAAQSDKRLGAHFEALWRFFLDRHSFYRVLAANFQVNDGTRTLGSLDFLIEDSHRNLIVHLELAVKFYLYCPNLPGPSLTQWIGPNPDDSLGAKFFHLIHHQLPLSTRVESQRALRAKGLPLPDCRIAIIKGYLFSPLTDCSPTLQPVNPGHLRGSWLSIDGCAGLDAMLPGAQWDVLDKSQWLDPQPALALSFPELERQLATTLQETQDPLMVQAAIDNRRHQFFVTPRMWPCEDA